MSGSGETHAEPAPGHPEVRRLIAPNPSPMTGEGTNTYLYRGPGDGCVVIDPGVDDPQHLAAIELAAGELGGGEIEGILISHDHPDHVGGAEHFGAPVLHPADGEVVGGLRAIATPGHADDHLCFITEGDVESVAGPTQRAGLPAELSVGTSEPVLFSADLILGEGSTFVQPGGGSLIAYLDSLRLVRDLAPTLICPGHGPWIMDPAAKVEEYFEHRLMRERNLVAALERGLRGRDALVDNVWGDTPPELRYFTALVLEAHLEKLAIESRLPEGESVSDVLGS